MYSTRSGRIVKKPDFYVPTEEVEDDFGEDEYDTEDDLEDEFDTESEDETDDEDDDLDGFIVDDDEEAEN